MKMTIRLLTLTALALTMVACSSDDNIADIPAEGDGIPFSATISINGDSQTRAYTSVSLDGYIDVEWRSGEQVALLYNTGSTPRRTIATVTSVSDGKATISATLNSNVTAGTPVTLIYPYWTSMFDAMTGDFNPDFFGLQSGSLTGDGSSGDNSISNHFDLRKGTGTITLATGTASLSSDVTMESQIAVWKLTLKDASNNSLQASTLEVDYKGVRAYATPGSDKSEFYMAVPAVAAGEISNLYITATKSNGDKYLYSKSGITLTASTYYQSTVKLSKLTVNRVISSSDTDVTLVDGDVVSGSGGTDTHITIADGATVTLDGLYNTNNTSYHGIDCLGDANIILVGSNSVRGVSDRKTGIHVPEGKTLTISGSGYLTAIGGDQAAGIGAAQWASAGHIIINGGRITATGGVNSAGIGGGSHTKFNSITITANASSVIATHGYGAWLPIGIGTSDTGSGSVTVDGVTPWSGSSTEHLNCIASTVKDASNHDVTRWTLTRK